tara:strand:- start:91 stop:327 length:237 start_codon:yes stop_codon:yes gene_type:complete
MGTLTEAQRVDLIDKEIAKKLEKLKKELINKNKKTKRLTGGQVKLDKDGSGNITAKDFKLLRDGNKFVAKQYGGKIGK